MDEMGFLRFFLLYLVSEGVKKLFRDLHELKAHDAGGAALESIQNAILAIILLQVVEDSCNDVVTTGSLATRQHHSDYKLLRLLLL